MSQIPSVPPSSPFSRSPSITLEDYMDISGNPLSQPVPDISGATVNTQETLPLTKTESLATQAECETPEDESESEDEDEPGPKPNPGEVGMVSFFLVGGLILSAFALFLSRPIDIQHPYSSRDYF
jgi:hypothetical protein